MSESEENKLQEPKYIPGGGKKKKKPGERTPDIDIPIPIPKQSDVVCPDCGESVRIIRMDGVNICARCRKEFT